MIIVKTADLTGAALDWAVAKCEGDWILDIASFKPHHSLGRMCFSTDWSQAGPIIEREGITISKEDGGWSAYFRDNLFDDDGSEHWQVGPAPLIAAMRCYVASKLGEKVEIPEELLCK